MVFYPDKASSPDIARSSHECAPLNSRVRNICGEHIHSTADGHGNPHGFAISRHVRIRLKHGAHTADSTDRKRLKEEQLTVRREKILLGFY
ncbi:hypothetical protein BDZ89DRAFT_133117 [Hymenopellis radicata]|nr:hypothetical protein BDZ89DRAFT_133117 [Hymenopellis radicata]